MSKQAIRKVVFAINGRGGVGKDTMVDYASKHFNVRNTSSVEAIKKLARVAGWTDEDKQTAKGRQLLVDLKKLFVEYNDLPQKYSVEQFEEFMQSDEEFMFVHIREPEEIEKFKKATGAKSLLITRKNVATTWDIDNENNVNKLQYDYMFNNDGTIEESGQRFIEFLKSF